MKRNARKHALHLNGDYPEGDEKDWWINIATEMRDSAEADFNTVSDIMASADDAKIVYVYITFRSMLGK
jgi:hypothetical protein